MSKVFKKFFLALTFLSVAGVATADPREFNFLVITPPATPFKVLQVSNPILPWVQQPICTAAGCSFSLENIFGQPNQIFSIEIGQDSLHNCLLQIDITPSNKIIKGHSGVHIPASVALLSESKCVGYLDYAQIYNKDTKLGIRIFSNK